MALSNACLAKILANHSSPPPFYQLCSTLAQAIETRGDAWRLASLATVASGIPQLRSVILRSVDIDRATIQIYTDVRSSKVRELRVEPSCALMCWCPQRQQQLRLSCRTTLLMNQAECWRALSSQQRKDYCTIVAPGEPLSETGSQFNEDLVAQNFCVIECNITAIDWLQISSDGHRRAFITPDDSHWICP